MELAETWLHSKSTASAKAIQGQTLLHYDRPENSFFLSRRKNGHTCLLSGYILHGPACSASSDSWSGWYKLSWKCIYHDNLVWYSSLPAPLLVWELPEAVAGSTDIHSRFQPFQTTNHVSPAEEVSLFWHNKLIGLQKSQMSELVHVPVEKTIL